MDRPRLREIVINRDWCKGCGVCIHFCPNHVLEEDAEGKVRIAHPENCSCCRLCELRCPELATEIIIEE